MLKTSRKRRSSGFTLVEMVIAVVILGILTSIGLPSFTQMLRNSEVRAAAESIGSGLQKSRAEAVTRNNNVTFTLGSGTSWTIAGSDALGPFTVESRSGKESSSSVTVVAKAADGTTDASAITFNNLGQAVPNAANVARIDLSATGGNKSLRVTVGAGGNAKVCDPSLTSGSSPRAC